MSGQIESLTTYLMKTVPARIQGFFASESLGGQLIPTQKNLGNGFRRLGIARQDIELTWEAYPYREYPPAMLHALVLAWLEESANPLFDELGLPDPSFEVVLDTEQQGRGDVTITLELADELIIIEDPGGDIPLDGTRWRLETPDIWVAEQFGISAVVDHGNKD
ncbi:phage tail protein [Enterobacter sp. WCHEn045836]|uniref:phage tail protein n=1 Tax=Enterobacter sp. WCHEn045836 TaxID=2497434 RepID=UPI000F838ABB|nr:phage tail protein [Enterobacter sp. WCHEn045836]RTP98382.1 phage tail protein [Enterobacter sp. WCHEn045836]